MVTTCAYIVVVPKNLFASALRAAAAEFAPELVAFIRDLVNCESPSDSPSHVNRLVDLLTDATRDCATATRWPVPGYGDHVLLDFNLQAPAGSRALALGHSDTVWPEGTLGGMPFRRGNGRLWGPGVLDMKSGIALLIFAVRLVTLLRMPVRRGLALLLVSDEEVGSPSSRAITEREALISSHVVVVEPGTGLAGKLKTSRKSVGHYAITVTGKAAHAGVDFQSGANAILEVSRVVQQCAAMT